MRGMTIGLAGLLLAASAPALAAQAPMEPATIALPGLSYQVLRSGPLDGVSPGRADTITVRYRGMLQNGKVFDTSAEDGKGTATFELGKLIPGWIGALQLMKPGDVWRLTLPPYLAYGHKGKPAHGIPMDATLVFEVELVSVTPATPK